MPRILAVFAIWLAIAGSALGQADVMERGRARSEAFLAGQLDSIWEAMTPELQNALGGGKEALAAFREQVLTTLGTEENVENEDVTIPADGMTTYRRTASWSDIPDPILMEWTFDDEGRIAGFLVRPAPVLAESRFLDYRTKADLRLPFDGTWYVYWGGRSLDQNYHAENMAQRFAYDFLVMREGSSFAGDDPSQLDSYYCWGEPILAPAAGTVVASANDLPDNAIGQTDTANLLGNHVVLDLGNSEFAFFAHLQQGSVRVEPGDSVARSEPLGSCGNSGNTSEPHLHMHLQNTAELTNGEGLPAQFQNYVEDGNFVDRGEPVKGQKVAVAE